MGFTRLLLVLAGVASVVTHSLGKQTVCSPTSKSPPSEKGTPNVIVVVTDDLDNQLGGMTALPKTKKLLGDEGATMSNWFCHTPVCCPSRAQMLTSRYFHNIRTAKAADRGCMHVKVEADLQSPFWDEYFAPHFQRRGFTVGVFGKHLNNFNPTCPPPGVDRWFVNGGGDYLNPSFTWASADTEPTVAEFNNCTGTSCYSTSVIGNVTLQWIRDIQKRDPAERKPFFAYVAVKAPHIQDGPGWPVAVPAPWYNNTAFNTSACKAPRTPNYNFSAPEHHWLVRQQQPMTHDQEMHSDELYRSRLQSLLSVDDLVAGMVEELADMRILNETFVIFTSDHGYQFGQFRMPQGKWNVYEHDIRIPFLARGPGIRPGTVINSIGSSVDVMPTALGLAGLKPLAAGAMDGRSLAPELVPTDTGSNLFGGNGAKLPLLPSRRTELLIEYYGLGDVVRYQHLEDTANNTFRAIRLIDETGVVGQRNLKLVEFTSWNNWNFTSTADEFELFDLDADPYEIHNIYSHAPKRLKAKLHKSLRRLYSCKGQTCP